MRTPALAGYREAEDARDAWAARHLGTSSISDWLLSMATLPLMRVAKAAIGPLRRRRRDV